MSVNIISLRCPNCNASLEIEDGKDVALCPYCDSKVLINKENSPIKGKYKYCKYCGQKIFEDAVICGHCGRQVEILKSLTPQVSPPPVQYTANYYQQQNTPSVPLKKAKNKWITLLLLLFFGLLGVHKFYEGKILLGIVYLFTYGLFFIGLIVDFFVVLFKPTNYYV